MGLVWHSSPQCKVMEQTLYHVTDLYSSEKACPVSGHVYIGGVFSFKYVSRMCLTGRPSKTLLKVEFY